MPYRFNPLTGNLDLVIKPVDNSVDSDTYTADTAISALKMVKITSTTTVDLADKTVLADAHAIGITITAAGIGQDIEVITFGQVDDASFTYAVNECLFLGLNGDITNTPPTTGHSVPIGKGLGNGSIFIDIDNLTIL